MMTKAATVELQSVRKEYEGGGVAVHGVDLTIRAGELVVLVGPSGCGKSTTLRMIAGLESITSGRLLIDGELVNDVPPASRNIAMVFQTYALYPHMSVRANLGFALRLQHVPKQEIETRVRAAAATLGLTALLDRYPRQLSGGQRQRVAIGRAIVREPAVFLFDEPLSNLDAALRAEMRRELAALHHRLGATMVYVTHDQVEAMTLGDRIVVMEAGRVHQVDTPAAVYDQPADTFVAGFLGSPPMNLLRGTLEQDGGRRAVRLAGADGAVVALPGTMGADLAPGPVVLGVRPEHVHASSSSGPLSEPGPRLDATVELVEALGHEQLTHLRIGDVSLAARGTSGDRPSIGQTVHVTMDPSRLRLFDGDSGAALGAT